MADDGIPPWVEYLSNLIDRRFAEQGARIDKLVTRDAFSEEQKRVNEKFDAQQQQIAQANANIQAEATARAASELAAANKATQDAQQQQRTARQTNWQWFALFAVPTVGAIVLWVINGGLVP
ncbi:MAG: hypothetical protein K0Q52_130 [Microbacterium sp.]|jgi:Flp pilus assembly protein TadB|nr:hypothetical protein [Microbacterium sp.]